LRRKHLEGTTPEVNNGKIVLGGAFMKDTWKDGETPPMMGSAMIYVAETKKQVLERMRIDIYTTSGVWDMDKVQIWPFRSAIRKAI
jgi:hypothetical protein